MSAAFVLDINWPKIIPLLDGATTETMSLGADRPPSLFCYIETVVLVSDIEFENSLNFINWMVLRLSDTSRHHATGAAGGRSSKCVGNMV